MEKEEVKQELDSIAIESDKVYEKFRLIYKELLSVKAGLPISVVLSQKDTMTPQQSETAKQVSPQLVEAEKVARNEVEFRAKEIERLKKELGEALSHRHEEILEQIKQQESRQIEALSVLGEIMVIKANI